MEPTVVVLTEMQMKSQDFGFIGQESRSL